MSVKSLISQLRNENYSIFHENVEVNGHLPAYKMKKINCKNYPDSNAVSLRTSAGQGLSGVLVLERSAMANCRISDTGCYIYETLAVTVFLLLFHYLTNPLLNTAKNKPPPQL